MSKINKLAGFWAVSAILCAIAFPVQADHLKQNTSKIKPQAERTQDLHDRTAPMITIPLFEKEDRQDLGSNRRTWSSKHYHSLQHKYGKAWDPSEWNEENWTAEEVITKFYRRAYLDNQYIDETGNHILVVGPNFYELCPTDKYRIVKLLSDVHGLASKPAASSVTLIDWETEEWVGQYNETSGLKMALEYAP